MVRDPVGRDAFITTLVAIILSPLAVALGYFMSHVLEAPRFQIEYITTQHLGGNHVMDADVRTRILSNPELSAVLRENIAIQQQGAAGTNCRSWLDGAPWNDDCLSLVRDVTDGMLGAVDADLRALRSNVQAMRHQRDGQALGLLPTSRHPMQEITQLTIDRVGAASVQRTFEEELQYADRQAKDLRLLSGELQRLEAEELPLTGEVIIHVGVLNSGDSDGVIAQRARLRCNDLEIALVTDTYKVVKSHSFEEIVFYEDTSHVNAAIASKWRGIILGKTGLRSQLLMTADRRTITTETYTPK